MTTDLPCRRDTLVEPIDTLGLGALAAPQGTDPQHRVSRGAAMSNLLTDAPLDPLESLDKATPRPVNWLWRFQLAAGKLAMLDGDPREGKSMVTLDLCTA